MDSRQKKRKQGGKRLVGERVIAVLQWYRCSQNVTKFGREQVKEKRIITNQKSLHKKQTITPSRLNGTCNKKVRILFSSIYRHPCQRQRRPKCRKAPRVEVEEMAEDKEAPGSSQHVDKLVEEE